MNEEKNSTFSIASLNTLGIPFLSPYPVDRYIAFCQAFERLRVDIINLQEVHTYNLFHLLKKNLPSYPYVAYERALPGPKGGLVTLSRYPLEKVQFTPFTYPKQMKHALLYASKLIHKKDTLVAKIQWPIFQIILDSWQSSSFSLVASILFNSTSSTYFKG